MNKQQTFVHLNVHSDRSLINGLNKPSQIVNSSLQNQQPAVAITDFCYTSGVVNFYNAALKKGIQPLIGCQLELEIEFEKESYKGYFELLVQDQEGYLNLNRLLERIYTKTKEKKTLVNFADLKDFSQGLIMLSGGYYGIIGNATLNNWSNDLLKIFMEQCLEIFPNRFYISLSRCERSNEEYVFARSIKLAEEYQIPVVAVNDVMFTKPDEYEIHKIRMAIADKQTISNLNPRIEVSPQQYFKSTAEMQELFADLPQALSNSVALAQRCALQITLGKSVLPVFDVEGKSEAEYLIEVSQQGLTARLEQHNITDEQQISQYQDRLMMELDVINRMGFAGYFLIVMEFIQWAKSKNISVGPGRGSGAGSLVAYALTITDIDPIPYNLLFERFLNPERISMPDFDIDFCIKGRNDVIQHVVQRYGEASVAQIMTLGTIASKGAVKDICRVLGLPYNLGESISKLIPIKVEWEDEEGQSFSKSTTLPLLLKHNDNFASYYKSNENAREIVDLAIKLEGVARQVGKHAAGIVISPTTISDYSGIFTDDNGEIVTQYDKGDIEYAGLVKFDFLGLRNLTIIDRVVSLIRANKNPDFDILQIDLQDPDVYQMLSRGETHGIFQLESAGMIKLIRQLKPSSFEDIVALVALFRPGPLESGMVTNFINRKSGEEEISYPHPDYQHELLKPILEPTYGIIVYQEQVMQIAQVLAGYSLGQADVLRRAMGKKDIKMMQAQQAEFMEGAEKQGIDSKLAGQIFELVDKFAGYGFNKSHSAAYALIAYQTAYLKHHYLHEFLTGILNVYQDDADIKSLESHIKECRRRNITVLPPDINKSQAEFTIEGDAIRYGLTSIKSINAEAAAMIVEARGAENSFTNVLDFADRLPEITAVAIKSLNYSGALDCFVVEEYKDRVRELNEYMINKLKSGKRTKQTNGLFAEQIVDVKSQLPTEHLNHWSKVNTLELENKALGFYFSGHPLDLYRNDVTFINKAIQKIKQEQEVQTNLLILDQELAEVVALAKSKKENARFVKKELHFVGMVSFVDIEKGKFNNSRTLKLNISDGMNNRSFKFLPQQGSETISKAVDIDDKRRELIEQPYVYFKLLLNTFTKKANYETGTPEEIIGTIKLIYIESFENLRLKTKPKVLVKLNSEQASNPVLMQCLIGNTETNRELAKHASDVTCDVNYPIGNLRNKNPIKVVITDKWLSQIYGFIGEDNVSLN